MVHNNTLPIFKQNFRVLFESIKTIDNIYVCQLPIFKYYVDNYPYIKFIHQTGKGLLFDLSIKTSKSYRGDVYYYPIFMFENTQISTNNTSTKCTAFLYFEAP
jgi:hypothetical protein